MIIDIVWSSLHRMVSLLVIGQAATANYYAIGKNTHFWTVFCN